MRCVHCRNIVELHSQFCAHCGTPSEENSTMESVGTSDSDTRTVAVAHLSNIAEAGYFSDELFRHRQIDSTVEVENHFNALMGFWSARFSILVDANQAAESRDFLQEMSQAHLIEEDYDELEHDFASANLSLDESVRERSSGFDTSPESRTTVEAESGINWVPFFLTLTAGSFVAWGVSHWNGNRQNNRPEIRNRSNMFWNDVSSPQHTWHQRLPNGSTRELEFDPDSRQVSIREFDNRGEKKEKLYDLSKTNR